MQLTGGQTWALIAERFLQKSYPLGMGAELFAAAIFSKGGPPQAE